MQGYWRDSWTYAERNQIGNYIPYFPQSQAAAENRGLRWTHGRHGWLLARIRKERQLWERNRRHHAHGHHHIRIVSIIISAARGKSSRRKPRNDVFGGTHSHYDPVIRDWALGRGCAKPWMVEDHDNPTQSGNSETESTEWQSGSGSSIFVRGSLMGRETLKPSTSPGPRPCPAGGEARPRQLPRGLPATCSGHVMHCTTLVPKPQKLSPLLKQI
jgi:hypothetical protein